MASQCPFYYYDSSFWSSSYCCRLLENKGQDYRMGDDWANEYCRRYNYEKCPYYNNRSDMKTESSGCFLTSACVHAKGLPDNCYELQTLRHFRDTYMKATTEGQKEIKRYYEMAPQIVDKINRLENSDNVYEAIYNQLILPCINLIEKGDSAACYRLYQSYTEKLCYEFLTE